MIKSKRLAIALFLLVPFTAAAQKTTTWSQLQVVPENALMVNLGGIALDYLNMSYYRSLGGNHAGGAYFSYLYHPVGSEVIAGYGYGITYRFYPIGKSLARFYYSPTIGVQRASLTHDSSVAVTGFLASGMVGWQWFVQEHFAVGLGLGARVITGTSGNSSPLLQDVFGASPILTLDLGYGW